MSKRTSILIHAFALFFSFATQAADFKPVPQATYVVFKPEAHFGKPVLGTVTRHRGAETKEFKSIREACRGGDIPEGGDLFVLSKGLFLVDKKLACNGPIGGRIVIKGQGAETIVAESSFVERKAAPGEMLLVLDSVTVKNLVLVNAVLTDNDGLLSNVYPKDIVTFENVLFDGSLNVAAFTKERACQNLPCFFSLFNMVAKPLYAGSDTSILQRQGAMLEVGTMVYGAQSKKFEVFEPEYANAMSYKARPKLKALVGELAAAKTKNILAPVKATKSAKEAAREMKANDPESYFPERRNYFENRPGAISPPASFEVKTFQEKLTPLYDIVLDKLNEGEF